ncbi:hypothetical protein IOCL1545_000300800 [Leishmania shawi]|uniref:Uncharacterized protein n=1 Tax=Leishmania shawi TaxID=5680 RepID=A0ABR3E9D5_9TRYP
MAPSSPPDSEVYSRRTMRWGAAALKRLRARHGIEAGCSVSEGRRDPGLKLARSDGRTDCPRQPEVQPQCNSAASMGCGGVHVSGVTGS